MQNVSEDFKTAISEPSRELKSRITLPGLTLDDDQIQLINLDSSLVFGEDFEIGTAPMDTVKIELIFSPEGYIECDYEDKECDAQIGIKLYDDTVEYLSIGLFTVEEVIKNDYKITLNCVDRMYKAEKDFINNLMFPTTIIDILESACEQSDILLATTSFANADYVVPNEPVFDNITCRTIFAQVAELAGGYAKINRQGQLEIITLGNASVRSITKDHYIDLKQNEVAVGKIDRVIVKVGEEAAEQGIGDNIYTIVDNMFVQDPNNVIGPVFNVLKNINYSACKFKWQGDFSLDLGDKITIDGYETYALDRKLSYTGGLGEEYKAPAKSNVERNSTGKSNIILDINNIKTQVKVIEGEITQTIESIEGEVKNEVAEQMKTAEIYTWIKYADDDQGSGISDNPAGKKYVGIATNKKNVEPSSNPSDYEWSLVQGANGDPGVPGDPGQDGTDGQTTYTWIMYANDALGNGISDSPDDKRYVGIATNKLTANKSVTPSDYEWSPLYDNVEIGGENRLFESKTNIEFFDGDVGRNLIKNGSFNQGMEGWALFWTPSLEIVEGVNGDNAIRVSRAGYSGSSRVGVQRTDVVKPQVGVEYTLSAWVRIIEKPDTSNNQIFIRAGDGDFPILTIPNTAPVGEWIYYTDTHKFTKATTGTMRFYVLLGKNGAIEVSNIEVKSSGLDISLIHGSGKPYYKVFNPNGNNINLYAAFANSRFAEPLEALGRVTVSLGVMVEIDREITINNSTFVVPGNRWTRIFFTKEFTENTTRNIRVYTPYSRKRKVVTEVGTKLIDSLVTDINTLYYRNLQVERGNVPTDHNLTPEELEGEITRSKTEIKQLKDSIMLVATRNENTGRFEITPDSIVQAIETTDGVGKLKTVKVTVDEYGLAVDDGAITIRDKNNATIITSDGLRAMYIITSSGELNGWQEVGIWDKAGTGYNLSAILGAHLPEGIIIDTAYLYTRSMPAYYYGHANVPNGFYHPRNLRLYSGQANDVMLDFPYSGSYGISFSSANNTDITNNAWGSSWSPSGQGVKTKVGDVKNYIRPGESIAFTVETSDSASQSNERYKGAMQLELVITGFLRG